MDKTATLESDMEQHRDIKRKAGLIDWIYCIVIKHEMLSIRIELYSPDPAALYALLQLFQRRVHVPYVHITKPEKFIRFILYYFLHLGILFFRDRNDSRFINSIFLHILIDRFIIVIVHIIHGPNMHMAVNNHSEYSFRFLIPGLSCHRHLFLYQSYRHCAISGSSMFCAL